MAIIGGNIESKEIGLQIGTSGTHNNTEIDPVTGFLSLKINDYDETGKPIYATQGTWISDVVDLGDKFSDFERVFTTNTDNEGSSFGVLTRVSDDGTNWSEWKAIAVNGAIQSDTKQFIQIKIELFAGFVEDKFFIDKNEYAENNEYVEEIINKEEGYIPLALSSNTSSSEGFAFSTSYYNSSYYPYRAFDGSVGQFRPANVDRDNFKLGFYFNRPRLIVKYKLIGAGATASPISWVFQASNDTTTGLDGTWVDLDSQNNVVWVSSAEEKEFSFDNFTRYNAYRVHVTKSNGTSSSYSSIIEFYFFESDIPNLQLKRNYEYDMTLDTTWTEQGSLHRKKIDRDEWVRIDKMNVLRKK